MIDQKTTVHVNYGKEKDVVLGTIVKFNYYQPAPGGEIEVTASGLTTDCTSVCKELVARVGAIIQVILISSVGKSEFTIKLDQVSVSESLIDSDVIEISLSGSQPDKE
ncbi:hypothetical protein [Pantoea agglomerans]|uniref:hypothetical protein n=1 Tax=Enterobacter agglomerans TaxID=549 RepID=UPI003C7A1E42